MKLISIQFASSEENHMQFFAQVSVDVSLPVETWHSGKHILSLYYPIEKIVANYMNGKFKEIIDLYNSVKPLPKGYAV